MRRLLCVVMKHKILTVSAQADGNSIVVSIGDNGCGMDEQMRLSMIQTLEHPRAIM